MEQVAAPDSLETAFRHCEAMVRDEDPDRAVAILFAPAHLRPALNALYAFDIETALVRDKVRQPMPGEIRLQWWRDRIEAAAASPEDGGQGSPVATALLETIRTYDLPADAFDRLLEARIFDLYDDPMPSRQEFEAYAGETASAIVILAAMILDRSRAPQVAGIAGHAGVTLTARRTLSLEVRHSSRGQVFVPGDILTAVGLHRETWLAGGTAAEPARAAMAAYAGEHARTVDAAWPSIPRNLRPAFLPLRLPSGGTLAPLRRAWTYWRAMREPEELR